jgi:GNAT superfamily N-acetyltransferase
MSALPKGYRLSFDPGDVDVVAAQAFLTRSYWAQGIELESVARSIQHSLCCTVHQANAQVGMARVISDYATYAYLTDVYVLEEYQGQGLASSMLTAIKAHKALQGVGMWMLFTRTAHSLYARFGWKPLAHPERAMLVDTRTKQT